MVTYNIFPIVFKLSYLSGLSVMGAVKTIILLSNAAPGISICVFSVPRKLYKWHFKHNTIIWLHFGPAPLLNLSFQRNFSYFWDFSSFETETRAKSYILNIFETFMKIFQATVLFSLVCCSIVEHCGTLSSLEVRSHELLLVSDAKDCFVEISLKKQSSL